MLKRIIDKSNKGWTYLLAGLEQPKELPSIVWHVGVERAHAGEVLKLNRYKAWLNAAGIKTVIDVGAHNGEFASAARALLPDAQIYSFEPQPECYERLSERMGKRGRFQSYCVALGDEQGEIEFWESSFSKSSSVLPMDDLHKEAYPWSAESKPVTVQIQTLDNYADEFKLEPKVLLKIDVQGYELKMLQGGLQVLEQVNYVVVETSFKALYEGQAFFEDVYNFLTAHGFEFAGNMDQMQSPIDGTILQVDSLYIRKS